MKEVKDFDVFLDGLDKTSSSSLEWAMLIGFFLVLYISIKLVQRSHKKADENNSDE